MMGEPTLDEAVKRIAKEAESLAENWSMSLHFTRESVRASIVDDYGSTYGVPDEGCLAESAIGLANRLADRAAVFRKVGNPEPSPPDPHPAGLDLSSLDSGD